MEVVVQLSNQDLWSKFHSNTTEMVVTKTGRKMFPKLEYVIHGLDPKVPYGLVLHVEQVDDNRYKFSGGEWSVAGRSDICSSAKNIFHHDGVMCGENWMRNPITFERVKITNNPHDTNPSHIFLQSMHKYIPVLTVFQLTPGDSPFMSVMSTKPPIQVARIRLACTQFIAVTAYQNHVITQLKIEHNPFAKGFRDGGDRKRNSPEDTVSPKRLCSPQTEKSVIHVPPMNVNPMWYTPYWNPYVFNPLLAQYRFGFPRL